MHTFVARQPILDRNRDIFAYELLYRDGFLNACTAASLDDASSQVIGDSCLVMGFDKLTRGKHIFINVTEQVIGADYLALLPKQSVIELLEDVRPTDEVLASCRRLKEEGFRIALDDFVYDPSLDPLLELADLIKVDWRMHAPPGRARLVPKLLARGLCVLAEKVETWDDYNEAAALGCRYFQGYFFSKPEVLKTRRLPAFELIHVQLLRELNRSEIDFDAVESLIKRETSLAYKLLRYINSAAMGIRSEVRSIRHAMVLLGHNAFRRWANLATVSSLSGGKTQELLLQASVRGRLGELLAPDVRMADRDQELFLLGMFSLLDAFLDRPMRFIVEELGLSNDLEAALLLGKAPLASVLDMIVAIERGDWRRVRTLSAKLSIPEEVVAAKYLEAVSWADSSGFAFGTAHEAA